MISILAGYSSLKASAFNSFSASHHSICGLIGIINDVRTGNATIPRLAFNAIWLTEGIVSGISILDTTYRLNGRAFSTGIVTGVLSTAISIIISGFLFPPPPPLPQQQNGV